MFRSANHNTFGAKVGEVLLTFALMWLSMLLVVGFFTKTGMMVGDFSTNIPVLGPSANFLLHSQHLTLGQALASSSGVMILLGTILFAPLAEEVAFRWFVCHSIASDAHGVILPKGKGLGVVLFGSFILFGLAHGHWYFSIMLQGVGGLWLARLWFRNSPEAHSSYFSCVTAHSLYNISVVTTVWLMAS